jgi:hypothetical protein
VLVLQTFDKFLERNWRFVLKYDSDVRDDPVGFSYSRTSSRL